MRLNDREIRALAFRRRVHRREPGQMDGRGIYQLGGGIFQLGETGMGMRLPQRLFKGRRINKRLTGTFSVTGRGFFSALKQLGKKHLGKAKTEALRVLPGIGEKAIKGLAADLSSGKTLKESAKHTAKSTLQASKDVAQQYAKRESEELSKDLKALALQNIGRVGFNLPDAKSGGETKVQSVLTTTNRGQRKLIDQMAGINPNANPPSLSLASKNTLHEMILKKYDKEKGKKGKVTFKKKAAKARKSSYGSGIIKI